jgi:hypothetical protein
MIQKNDIAGSEITHSICINGEDVLIESGIDANDIPHLMVDLQLHWIHWGIEMDAIKVMHDQNLGVSFTTIARLRALRGFADFDDNHVTTI